MSELYRDVTVCLLHRIDVHERNIMLHFKKRKKDEMVASYHRLTEALHIAHELNLMTSEKYLDTKERYYDLIFDGHENVKPFPDEGGGK